MGKVVKKQTNKQTKGTKTHNELHTETWGKGIDTN